MTDSFSIAIAQLNPTVGDIAGNAERLRAARAEARREGADLVIASELVVSGYPPEDLVLKPALIERAAAELERLAKATGEDGEEPLLPVGLRRGEKLYEEVFSHEETREKTGRAGLLVARSRVSDVQLLSRHLTTLEAAVEAADVDRAVDSLKRIVPEFRQSELGRPSAPVEPLRVVGGPAAPAMLAPPSRQPPTAG